MFTLLATALLGVALALFAVANTDTATVSFGSYKLNNIPLYLIALVPLILGLVASYLIYLTKDLSDRLTIGEQKDTIRKLKKENAELNKKNHKMELENTKIKAKNGEKYDEDSF